MSGPDTIDGSTVLFKATPIHEGPLRGYVDVTNERLRLEAAKTNTEPIKVKDPTPDFRSATYNIAKTEREVTLYRLHGGGADKDGPWWTPVKPEAFGKNAIDSRIDYAILKQFKNSMENCAQLRVPADTILFTGYAAEQNDLREYRHGGKCQVYLPREMVNELMEYNKTGDTSLLHKRQKEIIKNWEQRNFNLTNNSGKALKTNPEQFQKLQNTAKSMNVPDLSKTNANTFKQAATPQRLSTITYQPPTNTIRETRQFTQQSVKNTFINNNNIPRNQCYISSPWPGGIELVQSLPLHHREITDATKFTNPKISVQNSSLYITNQSKRHEIQKFGILSSKKILPCLSAEEAKALHEACTKSTKAGVMISLELYEDHIDTITDGFDSKMNPQIYETIKEADALLGNFIFGTNLFQAAVEENANIQLTKSDVSTYRNPYDVEYQLLTECDNVSLQAQKDITNFQFIGPHPKFVINKNAKLIIKDDMLLCSGCPLDISIRGIYLDYYGNTYYDDEGKRCYKNHPFIKDFKNNFWAYMEAYPILKKVATYAIFVGAALNDTATTKEKVNYQTLTKTLRKNSSCGGLEDAEIKILQAKEEIFRRKNSGPLAWNCLGNEWCKYDPIQARNFYFEALLEIESAETLINEKAKMEVDLYKKEIVRNACLGILTSTACKNEQKNKLTDGEKKILCTLKKKTRLRLDKLTSTLSSGNLSIGGPFLIDIFHCLLNVRFFTGH